MSESNPTVPGTSETSGTKKLQLDIAELPGRRLVERIHLIPAAGREEDLPRVQLRGLAGQHGVLMRLNHPVRVDAEGDLGDYAFAFCSQADVRLTGSVGHGVADGMCSGAIRIRGNAGIGAAAAMTGGTLAVYGSAGARCGAGMRGGSIFVRGDVGDETGVGALGGMIVIGGDAGENLGDAINNVTVFIRGQAASLAEGVTEAPLRKREQLRLGLLLINAAIRGDATDFRRVVPIALLEAEEAQRGEVVPNWR